MAPQIALAVSTSNMTSNAIGKSGLDNYHRQALSKIRASLIPYAHHDHRVPRERLSPMGPSLLEEDVQQQFIALGALTKTNAFDGGKVARKGSFERDYNNFMKFVDGDSPESPAKQINYRGPCLPYDPYKPQSNDLESSFIHNSKTCSYISSNAADTPPPPPPRSQELALPPTPPPLCTASSSMSSVIVTSSGHMPLYLSRLSPAPNKTKVPNYVNINCTSQCSPPQRGTSPVSLGSRQTSLTPNHLQHQMQNLSITGGSSHASQLDRPLYPVKHMGNVKVSTPPPQTSYSSSIQNWQPPTPEARKSPAQSACSWGHPVVVSYPSSPNSLSPTSSTPPPIIRGGQTARQAKIQTPIIMQSVKSTQVQKPVLQTAVAPTSPPVSAPPPAYLSSVPQKQLASLSVSQPIIQDHATTNKSPVSVTCNSIPTSDPPSYHTTMQALAAARGYNYIPVQENLVQELDLSSTPLAQIPISQVTAAEAVSQLNCDSDSVSNYSSSKSDHCPIPGKLSPTVATVETASSASRSNSPVSSIASHDTHALSQSPVSCLSAAAQSDMTLESGYSSSSQSTKPLPPPPPPPPPLPLIQKTMHQSPIPERKKISLDAEKQRSETKVRVYSPEAYKFFMEQRVENAIKMVEQRKHRQMQLEKEMKKIGLPDKDQDEIRKMLYQKESNYIRLKRAKMNKSMFQKIATIGIGAFGEVALVRKMDTNALYAMKTLRKADVLKRNQVAHVKAERDILAEADSEWVVKLYYSFQDNDKLYFIMEYIPGGDLMSLLIKYGIFEEPLARFYIGELVCAIESVHKMGFIHRDIKPDNILINKDGHIKLTDFGLCTGFRWTHNSKYYQPPGDHTKQESIDPCGSEEICRCNELKPLERRRRRQHLRCLAHSLVGTPNYIAPEVLARTGYTQLCDWWSVGVILYEMLVGQPPFMANTPAETQYKVLNWEKTLRIPSQAKMSSEARDMILRLLTHADKRLGLNGSQEVKNHPFLNGIDFEGGLRKQEALYIPKISHPHDTSNFDPIDPERLRSDSNDSDSEWVNSTNQPVHGFYEFTFRRFFESMPSTGICSEERDGQNPVYV